jgi:undecaprenyl-diphosphatase
VSLSAAILLGAIQGLTEFLPISSSGHLAVAQHFVPGFSQPGLLFDIVLHLGTLLAVLIYFRQEILFLFGALDPGSRGAPGRRLLAMLALGTIPAVVAGLLLAPLVEASFSNLMVVGGGLLVTAILLLASARLTPDGRGLPQVGVKDALVVGLFQSAALFPGVSRSGWTIVGGLTRGLSHDAAARFSFLLSVPAILGAAVYDFPRVGQLQSGALAGYLGGFATAFIVGYISIGVVLRLLAIRRFHLFGYYCLLAGGTVLVYVAYALS